MPALNIYHGIGHIASVDSKQVRDDLTITTVRVAVNYRDKRDGEWVDDTLWFELSAISGPNDRYNKATQWAERFAKGQQVHISGSPKLSIYTRKDGTPGVTIKLDNPQMDTTQKPKTDQDVF